ncbi:MAG: ATP-binding protein [Bacteroidales bacterium]
MKKVMIIPVGSPRAGKSTMAKQLEWFGCVSVSRDTIREELHGDKANMTNEELVTKIYDERLKEAMDAGHHVFIDNTNLKLKYRKRFTDMARAYGYDVQYFVFYVELEILKERAKATNFPFEVIMNMIKGMDIVDLKGKEDYDKISYIIGDGATENKKDPLHYVDELDNYNQNSKYHNLSLGGHMKSARKHAEDKGYSLIVQTASLLHDLAKPYVKVVNEDGTWSYPGHAVPSAYQILSIMMKNTNAFMNNEDIHKVALLASKHMDRFQDYGRKYIRKTTAELENHGLTWEDLEQVWESDVAAH